MRALVPVLLVCFFAPSIHAGVITENNNGNDNDSEYWGQSFTTPSGGPWNDITFNWLLGGDAEASGTAYIFASAYTGTPNGLSSSSPLAASTGVVSNEYVFPASLILQPGTEYFLYSDTFLDVGAANTGPTGYYSGDPGENFQTTSATDFVLSGDVAPGTPEPSTSCLLAVGFLALCLLLRNKSGRKGVGTEA